MKSLLFTVVMLVFFVGALFAQSTTIKLPTADNNSSFVVTDNADAILLKTFGFGGFYILGNFSGAALPVSGAGMRLMWDPLWRIQSRLCIRCTMGCWTSRSIFISNG
jgi:hypothetical protein